MGKQAQFLPFIFQNAAKCTRNRTKSKDNISGFWPHSGEKPGKNSATINPNRITGETLMGLVTKLHDILFDNLEAETFQCDHTEPIKFLMLKTGGQIDC